MPHRRLGGVAPRVLAVALAVALAFAVGVVVTLLVAPSTASARDAVRVGWPAGGAAEVAAPDPGAGGRRSRHRRPPLGAHRLPAGEAARRGRGDGRDLRGGRTVGDGGDRRTVAAC